MSKNDFQHFLDIYFLDDWKFPTVRGYFLCQLVPTTEAGECGFNILYIQFGFASPQPVKIDLDKKSFPKQKTIQNFNIDAQGFRKTKNKNPPTWEVRVTR